MDAPSATAQTVATKAQRFLDLIVNAKWRDACAMCWIRGELFIMLELRACVRVCVCVCVCVLCPYIFRLTRTRQMCSS